MLPLCRFWGLYSPSRSRHVVRLFVACERNLAHLSCAVTVHMYIPWAVEHCCSGSGSRNLYCTWILASACLLMTCTDTWHKLLSSRSHSSEDDLTHKLSEIVKANMKLARMEATGAPQHILQEFSQLLQFHITTYIDNTMPGLPVAQQRSGRPIKSISQRLKVPLLPSFNCRCFLDSFLCASRCARLCF